MQDDALLEQLQNNPDTGMSLLMKQYGGLVYAVVKGRLSGSAFCAADIEHCVADTFSEFYCDLGKYHKASGSIKSFLCVIAKHNALDYLRRHDKMTGTLSLDDEALADSAETFSVEEQVLWQDFRRELLEEIRRLGEPDCEIILRKYYLSQSSKEIADKLAMTVSAVDTRTHRAIRKLREKFGGATACAVLLLSAGIGTYAYAAEQKEYNAAVQFFNQYALPTEGLSRGEIKAVYRDIVTDSFTYSVTAKVIEKSISDTTAGGFEIMQEEPSPEEIKSLWNYKNSPSSLAPFPDPEKTAAYLYHSEYKLDEKLGFDVHDRSWLEKQENGEIIWSVSFTEFYIEDYKELKDGVIVFGREPRHSSSQKSPAWLAKVDENGSLLWKLPLENGFQRESVAAVLENADGTYTVFSRGELEYFCFSQYDADGTLLYSNKTRIGNYGIWNAAQFGDGYIVQLGSYVGNEYAKIVKVDSSGSITGSFSYSSGDCYYYIADMIEFEGKLYLSGHSVPKLPDEEDNAGGRYDIARVLSHLDGHKLWDIASEELTPLVREQYTALLLICEPDEGTPQEFYSIKGSLGDALAIDDTGNLLWKTASITNTFYSPLTSAYTIGGTCTIFEYSFDKNGALCSQKKTGLTVPYYR